MFDGRGCARVLPSDNRQLQSLAQHAQGVSNARHREITAALKGADYMNYVAFLGAEVVASTPAESARLVEGELERWTKVIRQAGLKGGLSAGRPFIARPGSRGLLQPDGDVAAAVQHPPHLDRVRPFDVEDEVGKASERPETQAGKPEFVRIAGRADHRVALDVCVRALEFIDERRGRIRRLLTKVVVDRLVHFLIGKLSPDQRLHARFLRRLSMSALSVEK